MLGEVLFLVLGLAALLVGAEGLVRGASGIALTLGISPLVVGLTIVAFGTSAPEVAVSVGAVLHDANDIAIGNVVGSNIFNVLVILGISALIAPLTVNVQLIRQEVPVMIGASLLLLVLMLDARVGRVDAAILLTLLVVYTVILVRQSRAETLETREVYSEAVEHEDALGSPLGGAAAVYHRRARGADCRRQMARRFVGRACARGRRQRSRRRPHGHRGGYIDAGTRHLDRRCHQRRARHRDRQRRW